MALSGVVFRWTRNKPQKYSWNTEQVGPKSWIPAERLIHPS